MAPFVQYSLKIKLIPRLFPWTTWRLRNGQHLVGIVRQLHECQHLFNISGQARQLYNINAIVVTSVIHFIR